MTEQPTPPQLPLPSAPSAPPQPGKTSGFAIASLIAALLPVPIVGLVMALVFSSKARKQIRESQGRIGGSGLAIAGMIVGLLVGGITLVAALAGLAAPVILATKKKADAVSCLSNGKQLFMGMMEFESEYGHYPDDQSANKNPKLAGFTGEYANAYLAQLIAGGYVTTESLFYAGHGSEKRMVKADDVITPRSEILKKGENGFAYVMANEDGLIRGLSSSDDRKLPLLVAPMMRNGSFDRMPFDKKVVVIKVDGSSSLLKSDEQAIFTIGGKSGWVEKLTPVVKLPE